jgi:DEAD/DEAH box helicase domain-containing protein
MQPWHHCGRVAGLYRYNPAPSEPDVRCKPHPAQASHKLLTVPECIC